MRIIKCIFGILCLIIGFAAATQKYASLLNYHPSLGTPIFVWNGIPIYWPWKWALWTFKYSDYAPKAFDISFWYVAPSLLVIFLIITASLAKKSLTSHGTAKWAEYGDLKKMELIAGSGVIIGLYDKGITKWFSNFLRWFDTVKKTKEAFGQLSYDKKVEKKREKYEKLAIEIDDSLAKRTDRGTADYKQLVKKSKGLWKYVRAEHKYDAKKENKYSIYPFIWFYDKCFKFYSKLDHFYLRENSNRHMLVVAPTRSGKGVGLIIPTLLGSWRHSAVINDIKGENWGVTAGYRKKMGHKVIKYEPTATDGSSARWNPLDEVEIGTKKEVSQAQNIAAIIADYEGKGKPDHWTANAANVITTVILFLKYAHCTQPDKYPQPSLATVAAFLKSNFLPVLEEDGITPKYKEIEKDGIKKNVLDYEAKGFIDTLNELARYKHVPPEGIKIDRWDFTNKKYIKVDFRQEDLEALYPEYALDMQILPGVHPVIYKNFTEITSKAEQELGSIISTANTALKEYLDPVLNMNMSVSDFCIDDVMNYDSPVSVFLIVPPGDLSRLTPVFRLFFEMIIKHHAADMKFIDGKSFTNYKHKCLLLMDEFASLGALSIFARALSYIAGYGLKAFIICQGIPQINNIYTKDNEILMNCHTKIYYAPNDNDTAKYISEALGKQTIITESTSQNNSNNKSPFDNLFNNKSVSKNEQSRDLMTADEIIKLGDKEIIHCTDHPPLLTYKVKYYENKYFTKRLMGAPVVSDIIRVENGSPIHPNKLRDSLLASSSVSKKTDAFSFDESAVADNKFNFDYEKEN